VSRRAFLTNLGVAAAAGVAATALGPIPRALAVPQPPNVDVAVVGAGMAGLACADTLRQNGVIATLYEARDRVGGRVHSMGGAFPGPVDFPGQVVERGGEFIDNLHLTMKGYAQEFGFALEDFTKEWYPGEVAWYFGDEIVPEAVVVDEFRALVGAMVEDLSQASNEISANNYTPFDQALDLTSLKEYLETRGAGNNIKAAIDVAYTTEFGREIDEQSCINFLYFIHADKRSAFLPFGIFSDERWHIIDGNEGVPKALFDRFTGPAHLDAQLVAVRKLSDGRIELTFGQGASTFTAIHDAVVLTVPLTILRDVALHENLGLPPSKQFVINETVYGDSAKLLVGFNGRHWADIGQSGCTYSDLRNHQITWEVNPINATAEHAVLVDYSGGDRAAGLKPNRLNHETTLFLTDLGLMYPGTMDAVTRTSGNKFLAHLEHWPSDPFLKGGYVSNHPGYFTTIEGIQADPVGNLYFAGEHTDSFYEWQGFMEGAANSGIRAAQEVLADFG
jgi:monoamine oxidase